MIHRVVTAAAAAVIGCALAVASAPAYADVAYVDDFTAAVPGTYADGEMFTSAGDWTLSGFGNQAVVGGGEVNVVQTEPNTTLELSTLVAGVLPGDSCTASFDYANRSSSADADFGAYLDDTSSAISTSTPSPVGPGGTGTLTLGPMTTASSTLVLTLFAGGSASSTNPQLYITGVTVTCVSPPPVPLLDPAVGAATAVAGVAVAGLVGSVRWHRRGVASRRAQRQADLGAS